MQKSLTGVIVAVLVGIGLVINYQLNTATAKIDTYQQQQQQREMQQQQQQAQAARTAPPPKPQDVSSVYTFNTGTTGPAADETDGQAGASETLSIGYSWTPALLKNQDGLKKILSDAQKWAGAPGRRVQIVCVDIPVNQRQSPDDAGVQAGVAINGKPAPGLNGNPGTDITEASFNSFLSSLK